MNYIQGSDSARNHEATFSPITLKRHSDAVEGVFANLRDHFAAWDGTNIEDIWQHRYRFHRGMGALSILLQVGYMVVGLMTSG